MRTVIDNYVYRPGPPTFSFSAKIQSFAYPGGDCILKPGQQLTTDEAAELAVYYGSAVVEGTVTHTEA